MEVQTSTYSSLDLDNDGSQKCVPNDGYDYDDDRRLRNIVSLVVPLLFGVVFIVGLIGNALLIAAVVGKRGNSLRCSTTLLIGNLAISSLLFIVMGVPFTGTDYVFSVWPFGAFMCKAVQYLVHVSAFSNAYTLVLLALDRYLVLVQPTSSLAVSMQKPRNIYITLAVQWIIVLLCNIPLIFTHGTDFKDLHDCEWRIPCMFQFHRHDETAFRIGFTCTFLILPVILIVLFGTIILISRQRYSRDAVGYRSCSYHGSEQLLTRIVLVAVIVFFASWTPLIIILLLKSLTLYPINSISIPMQIVAHILAYSSICFNPIICAAIHPGFRSSFRSLLCCRCGSVDPAPEDFDDTGTEESIEFLKSKSYKK